MKINWYVRFKQWDFIVGMIVIFFGINQIELEDLRSWKSVVDLFTNFVKSPYLVGYFILSLIGYVRDWTTKGISDSNRALKYIEPNDSE